METDIVQSDDCEDNMKKRKRPSNFCKLLVGDKVEVRSLEDGSKGSWHSGVVKVCENGARSVQYDYLLCDDGSQSLTECINVHTVVDGATPRGRMRLYYRSLIRPLPPPYDLENLTVHYGQCVDAYYNDAWWEGVVFDHDSSSKTRSIFFPDIGDEMQIEVDKMRITLDWDEFTSDWKPRGSWLFLELLKKLKQENLVHISARQIWFEMREKEGFGKIEEWTNCLPKKDVWESLLREVLSDNSKLAAETFFEEVIESTSSSSTSNQISGDFHSCVSARPAVQKPFDESHIAGHDLHMVPEDEFCTDSACKSMIEEGNKLVLLSSSSTGTAHEETPCNALPIVPHNAAAEDEPSRLKESDTVSGGFSSYKRKKRRWEIAGTDIIPKPEFFPSFVLEYPKISRSKRRPTLNSTTNMRKHLAYLGWKVEVSRDEGFPRMRYTSPGGKSYMSLVTACSDPDLVQSTLTSIDLGEDKKVSALPPSCARSSSPSPCGIVEPERFPEAVKLYSLLGMEEKIENTVSEDVKDKAKRHLRASGWSLWYTHEEEKQVVKYSSPSGKTHCSLVAACKAYIEGEVNNGTETAEIFESGRNKIASHEAICKLSASERLRLDLPKELIGQAKPIAVGEQQNEDIDAVPGDPSLIRTKVKKPDHSEKEKRKHASKLSAKVRGDFSADYSIKCSKRAAKKLDSSVSFHSPRTVLSWLIDNNAVLPRAKVYYLGKKTGAPLKEGRISREGIKCSCCQVVFGLSKFEAHAGSTNHRPAANIFLEDGRSLFDCQSQVRRCNGIKNMLIPPCPQPKRRRCLITNDYICSVCHFGGELVLCDNCPSSFHPACIDLKDIPDGDWFCPSCCCGICKKNRLYSGAKQNMEGSVLKCHQCELQYHVTCVLRQGNTNLDSCSKGKWFCNRKCEEIFLGLRKLLGKPVVVEDDNLTWTLLKYIPKNDDSGDDEMEPPVDTYCKLNLAVSVMHECFEPVNEPRSRRDIVEDVIFSRSSDLNRLNFQGFYTVLLLRDDEIITVAAVRVYGEKVAEVPLVATRFQYRRLGMCRFLMNELEKKLKELGVERLVVPAAPSVLSTWTTSFGFSELTESQRLNLLPYVFLDFQGTAMCQKLLTESSQPIRTQLNFHDDCVGGIDNGDSDKNSTSSEVLQAEQIGESGILYKGPEDTAAVGGVGGTRILPLVLRVNQQSSGYGNQLQLLAGEGGAGELKESCENDGQSGLLRCYKRRRVSAC